jgi:hypothetical protein
VVQQTMATRLLLLRLLQGSSTRPAPSVLSGAGSPNARNATSSMTAALAAAVSAVKRAGVW